MKPLLSHLENSKTEKQNRFEINKKSNNLITCLHLYKHEDSWSKGPVSTTKRHTHTTSWRSLYRQFGVGLMQRHRPLLLTVNIADIKGLVLVNNH